MPRKKKERKEIVFVVGLPGSGKTMLAKRDFPRHHLVDDPKDLDRVEDAIYSHSRIVICDPHLCMPKTRQAMLNWLATEWSAEVYDLQIKWVWFACDPEACRANVKRREDAGDHRQVLGFIEVLSAQYKPEGPEVIPVWAPNPLDDFVGQLAGVTFGSGWRLTEGPPSPFDFEEKYAKGQWKRWSVAELNPELKGMFVATSWMTGGVGGGSCWDDGDNDRHFSIEGEHEPEMDGFLIPILEAISPGVTIIQYKKIVMAIRSAMNTGSTSVLEYYGNSTHYAWKGIRVDKLFEILSDLG